LHRHLLALFSVFLLLISLPGISLAEPGAPAVTIGLVPAVTDQTSLMIRGTAPRGQIVALTVNGELVARVAAEPTMDVYRSVAPLSPGENRIEVTLEGNAARAETQVFRTTVTFSDIERHWARNDIEMLATLGIVNGIGQDRFGPDEPLTRAQFAKLVALALRLPAPSAPELTFTDRGAIPGWAQGYVAAAASNGLIRGFDDGTFRADEQVTRAQVAVIGARALRLKGADAPRHEGRSFTDAPAIPDWARADVDLLVRAGLIGNFWGDAFRPGEPATRAEAAAVVRRLYMARP
jgi:hypothetical protein